MIVSHIEYESTKLDNAIIHQPTNQPLIAPGPTPTILTIRKVPLLPMKRNSKHPHLIFQREISKIISKETYKFTDLDPDCFRNGCLTKFPMIEGGGTQWRESRREEILTEIVFCNFSAP